MYWRSLPVTHALQAPWPADTWATWYMPSLRKHCAFEISTDLADLSNLGTLFWTDSLAYHDCALRSRSQPTTRTTIAIVAMNIVIIAACCEHV